MSKLIIITAPSGAGKTTIVRHLLASFSELAFSISATTRARRPHE
ncbi:MAG: guanylate kinase, partial [Lewinella sp.]|nr:guanylate kinase [Lewinella sp.]